MSIPGFEYARAAEARAVAAEAHADREQAAQQASQMELYRLASAKAALDQRVKTLTADVTRLLDQVRQRDAQIVVAEEERVRIFAKSNRIAQCRDQLQLELDKAKHAMRPLRIAAIIAVICSILVCAAALTVTRYAVTHNATPGAQHGREDASY